ncbi:MAG: hypothetical protein ACE5GY_10975 [Thermodesulfobacteriota bacterium]
MREDYFDTILAKVMAQGDRLGLTGDDYAGLMAWAKEHEPGLYAEEAKWFAQISSYQEEQADKQGVLAWGKALIKIFEKYAKWKEKKAAAAAVRPPEPPKRYEPRQGRLGL